ncbi:MAG: hypothetical protein AAF789_02060 [Bacteroidota bacterium]
MKKWLKKHWFIAFIFIASTIARLLVYTQHSYANGWDAYFYLVQIKSYLEEGAMHADRLSLFYPILLAAYFFIGKYELAYQITSALIVGFFSAQITNFSRRMRPETQSFFLVGAITLVSPHLTYVGAQFPKNLLGVSVLLCLLHFAFKREILKTGLLLVVNFFIHKMTAALAILLCTLIPIAYAVRAKSYYFYVGFLFLFGLLLLFPQPFLELPALRVGFGFASPNLHGVSFVTSISNSITKLWTIEIIVMHLLTLVVALLLVIQKKAAPIWYVIMVLLLLLIFPFLEWSQTGLAFRLLMVFIILVPLLINFFTVRIRKLHLTLVLVCTSGLMLFSSYSFPTTSTDPSYATYSIITDKIERLEDLKPELIIAHKALAEYYTFQTGKDALPWIPEYDLAKEKLWRISHGISEKTLKFYSKDSLEVDRLIHCVIPDYLLVREDVWSACMNTIKADDPELYESLRTWKNPDSIRPDYMLKNQ